VARLRRSPEKTAKTSESRRGFSQPRLQCRQPLDDRELRRILDMTFTAQAIPVGFANLQTTFNPVLVTTGGVGKITSSISSPP